MAGPPKTSRPQAKPSDSRRQTLNRRSIHGRFPLQRETVLALLDVVLEHLERKVERDLKVRDLARCEAIRRAESLDRLDLPNGGGGVGLTWIVRVRGLPGACTPTYRCTPRGTDPRRIDHVQHIPQPRGQLHFDLQVCNGLPFNDSGQYTREGLHDDTQNVD
jgi:hypothetical protein